jgi:hypothetical protein
MPGVTGLVYTYTFLHNNNNNSSNTDNSDGDDADDNIKTG